MQPSKATTFLILTFYMLILKNKTKEKLKLLGSILEIQRKKIEGDEMETPLCSTF